MKKILLALCVCAGLCACSSDDDVISSSSVTTGSEAAAFITVNLKDVGSSTRATSDGYAVGDATEHTVSTADFYFYGSSGNYMAKGNATANDLGTGTTGSTGANIEWNSNTVVAVYGLDGDHLPTQMLTVLNSSIDLSNKTLAQATATLAGTPTGETTNGFIMSTSVYEDGSAGTLYNYTPLTTANFALEPINIEEDYTNGDATPVEVYVERLAAKVQVGLDTELSEETPIQITSIAGDIESESLQDGIYVQLLGWDVNGTARDAYLVKQADNTWNSSTFGTWTDYNSVSDHRCFWAYSPNYGVAHDYPTTSKGNTDDDENGTTDATQSQLDDYLKYTSLNNAIAFSGSTYIGENTNTAAILDSISNTGITNVLVKAQAGTMVNNEFTPQDIVEFHELYYTAADFCQKCVDDVVAYDFTVLLDEVIDALEGAYPGFASYIASLKDAVYTDHVWCTNIGTTENLHAFGGEKLSLYNAIDGNVKIYYKTTPPKWSDGTVIDQEMADKYPDSDIVYGDVSLDAYDFWFHVDQNKIEGSSIMALAGLIKEITDSNGNSAYYMPLNTSVTLTTAQGHSYDLRNYLLRAITEECDGIDSQFGSHYPNFYNQGLMYYHVPIEHLNNSIPTSTSPYEMIEANYGIVRNHWYDVTITGISTMGRGIAQPTEVIIPQPEIPYYYVAADINILSWKMVNQSVAW